MKQIIPLIIIGYVLYKDVVSRVYARVTGFRWLGNSKASVDLTIDNSLGFPLPLNSIDGYVFLSNFPVAKISASIFYSIQPGESKTIPIEIEVLEMNFLNPQVIAELANRVDLRIDARIRTPYFPIPVKKQLV